MSEMRKLMETINTIAEDAWNDERVNVSEFKGKTFVDIDVQGKDQINFKTADGEVYEMYHVSDCCESVYIEDIVGDIADLIGTPMLEAEEVVSKDENPPDRFKADDDERDWYPDGYRVDSYTWTFYKLGTIKGHVTLRWYGTSNGYYSERVSVFRKNNEDKEL